MARRIRRSAQQSAELDSQVADYLLNRSMRERATFHENKYKAQFMDLLAEVGELQEGGHRVLMLDEPLVFSSYGASGRMTEKDVVGIRRVKRETTTLNAERVMKLLEAKDMVAECTTTEVVLNEDAVLAANFEGKISDEEMAALYDKSENYAFFLVEE
jgi:hypothetical protein